MNIVNNSFLQVLQQHRNGELLDELSTAMNKAIQATKEFNRPSKLHFEMEFVPTDGAGAVVTVAGEVSTKLPKPKPLASVFYTTDSNCLVKSDPNQQEMKLQEVPKPVLEPVVVVPPVAVNA